MTTAPEQWDALVIGAGFYGCAIGLHLRKRGIERVLVVDREADLLTRASYGNQARVHNGYHYPRSFVTAYRSRVNFLRFSQDFAFAVGAAPLTLYAVPSARSKVTPRQFERFMHDIGAKFRPARASAVRFFEPRMVTAIYEVEERVFNAARLRAHFASALPAAGVTLRLHTEAQQLVAHGDQIEAQLRGPAGVQAVRARLVFNCAYARLNRNVGKSGGTLTALKHELAEVALVQPPKELENIGVTLMDGPFFSFIPFPSVAGCHSLTHVRYTPHGFTLDADGAQDPFDRLLARPPASRVDFMIADAARYMPALKKVRHVRSLFELKTVLVQNEVNDGRPILFRRESFHPRAFSILGGKIDNVYDILVRLDAALAELDGAAPARSDGPRPAP
jgi:glycine/D-amino acid oxidase-like deaminating enzyme